MLSWAGGVLGQIVSSLLLMVIVSGTLAAVALAIVSQLASAPPPLLGLLAILVFVAALQALALFRRHLARPLTSLLGWTAGVPVDGISSTLR